MDQIKTGVKVYSLERFQAVAPVFDGTQLPQALRLMVQKKNPSVSVEAGVSVTVLPSRERGCGLSAPKSLRHVSATSWISKSGLVVQKLRTCSSFSCRGMEQVI